MSLQDQILADLAVSPSTADAIAQRLEKPEPVIAKILDQLVIRGVCGTRTVASVLTVYHLC